uniref:Uncharacterized protein n=1 Tax=Anopheles atroparvus TaxID=41427 RepID=A0AAG5DAD5_ANOAO
MMILGILSRRNLTTSDGLTNLFTFLVRACLFSQIKESNEQCESKGTFYNNATKLLLLLSYCCGFMSKFCSSSKMFKLTKTEYC